MRFSPSFLDEIRERIPIADVIRRRVTFDRKKYFDIFLCLNAVFFPIPRVARINHSCSPNCRKFFDSDLRMHVLAARDIDAGQEITLSYTHALVSTPLRQVGIFLHSCPCMLAQQLLPAPKIFSLKKSPEPECLL